MNKIQPGLNYDKHDLRFILLGKVFKFIENGKVKDIYNRNGINNRAKFIIYLKIFFMHIFFNYTIFDDVSELNRSPKLRKFTEISEVQDESQVYEYLSRYTLKPIVKLSIQYLESFLNHVKKKRHLYYRCNTCRMQYQYFKEVHLSRTFEKIKIKIRIFKLQRLFCRLQSNNSSRKENKTTRFHFNTSWSP